MPRRTGAPRRGRLVTLTSDVGPAYAAQMKAVLLRRLPPSQVVELTHDLRPHAIPEAAFLLRAMAQGFPRGSVHVVVVDPGVGGHRAPVVVRCSDGSLLVGPDNGVLYPLADELGQPRAWRLDPEKMATGPRVGTTFDGRDLFAPAAALLASGTLPSSLGDPVALHPYRIPRATRRPGGAIGRVVHVDHFGNLITNIPSQWVPRDTARIAVRCGRAAFRSLPWVRAYEEAARGGLGVLGSSFGTLEVFAREGNAARRTGGTPGRPIRFRWGRVVARRT